MLLAPRYSGLETVWDMYARGTIVGLTGGATRAHIVRATLEAIAYQVRDVLETMEASIKLDIPLLKADGGGSANRFLMQFQADLLGVPVEIPEIAETTALGAAYLAGLAVGVWGSEKELVSQWRVGNHYEPTISQEEANNLYAGWQRAVERARNWEMP